MAQTPVSASVKVLKNTTTLYTVPSGKTAIVKGVVGGSVVGNASATYTVNKVSGGTSYPITTLQTTAQVNATGGTVINGNNLLQAPITLTAGESISIYTGSANAIQIPNISTYINITGSTAYINQIVYSNSIFIAVGYFGVNSAFILRSTDGITWTQIIVPTLSRINSIVYGNGYWVAVPYQGSDQGKIYYSTDNGLTWTSLTVNSAQNCNSVVYANSTWVSLWGNCRLYTATTPASWTVNTAFTNYVYSSTSGYVSQIAWNGTYWILSGNYLGIVYSADLSTYTSVGSVNFGYYITGSDTGPLSYSSTYSKWYATLRKNGTNGVYSSTDGRAWTNLTTASFNNLYGIEVAGSNSILLGVNTSSSGSGANSPYLKSTDGTTWSVATDVRSYVGPLIGLENGYFVKWQSTSPNAYYITTDPTSLTGTSIGVSIGSFNPSNLGAAATSGKWMVLGFTNSGNIYIGGGTSGTNINAPVDSGYDIATYGYPVSITYNATDNYFYWTTSVGYIMKQLSFNAAVVNITRNVSDSGANSIFYFGGYLYNTTNNGSSYYYNNVYTSSSNNYSSYIQYTVTNSYVNPGIGLQTNLNNNYFSKKFAASSTKLICLNSYAFSFNTTTTNPTLFLFDPAGTIHYQRINNTDVVYGGSTPIEQTTLIGIYQSADLTTTQFTGYLNDPSTSTVNFGGDGAGYYGKNNFMAYASSAYYIVGSNNQLYSGTSFATMIGTNVSTTAVNGESWSSSNVQTELSVSGSDFYTFTTQSISTNGLLQIGKTTNISNAVNNSIMTGSIVEIS